MPMENPSRRSTTRRQIANGPPDVNSCPLGSWDLVLRRPQRRPLGLGHSPAPLPIESRVSSFMSQVAPVGWWSVSSRLVVGHRSFAGRLVVGHRSVGGRLVVGLKRSVATPISIQPSTKQALAKSRSHQTDIKLICAHKIAPFFAVPVSRFTSPATDIQHECAHLFRPSALRRNERYRPCRPNPHQPKSPFEPASTNRQSSSSVDQLQPNPTIASPK